MDTKGKKLLGIISALNLASPSISGGNTCFGRGEGWTKGLPSCSRNNEKSSLEANTQSRLGIVILTDQGPSSVIFYPSGPSNVWMLAPSLVVVHALGIT